MSILEQISETFNRSKAIRVLLSHLLLSNKCKTSPTGGVVHRKDGSEPEIYLNERCQKLNLLTVYTLV